MNIKAITRYVGLALLVSAFFLFLSLIVSIVDGIDSGFSPLAISFLITLVVGAFPFIFVRKSSGIMSMHEGYLVIVLSWFLSFVFGMMPYVLWGGEFSIVNAWFESVSGFTATGATILRDIEALPRSLLFWRSSTHFIGGLGVVVFILMVLPQASTIRFKLTNLELSSLSKGGYNSRPGKYVKMIIIVYFGLFISEALLLFLAGMPVFDAVNHAFSNVATGGFSIKNQSIGHYGSLYIDAVVMVFMILSSLNFVLLYSVFATRSLRPLRNPVVKYFFGCIAVLGLVMSLSLRLSGGYESWGRSFLDGYFHIISYMTTTGFAIADINHVPVIAAIALMLAGFQCACAGSTTGGLKADRILLAFKAVQRQIHIQLHPASVKQISMGGSYLRDEAVLPVMTYIVLYIMIIVLSSVLLILVGVNPLESFSGSLASVGNVGPALESIGAAGNFSAQPSLAKLIYSLDMFFGRVEIYPVLVAVSIMLRRSK